MKFLKRIKWGIAKRIRLMICPYDKLFSDTKNSCHFIGIGGIGMSALAFIMKAQGFDIRGSDMKETAITEKLRKAGIEVSIGHNEKNLDNRTNVVVVSSAIPRNNPEIDKALDMGIPIVKRSFVLGQVMKHKKGIAIAGTHGKTTTTTMISLILERAGLDPVAMIGGEVRNIGGKNYLVGKGEYMVAEACEYDRSFLDLEPLIAVITNIEADHLDCYLNIEEIKSAFTRFVSRIPENGLLVLSADDNNAMEVAKAAQCNVIGYGFGSKNRMQDSILREYWEVEEVSQDNGETTFVLSNGHIKEDFSLKIPGKHNVSDAAASIIVTHHLGVDTKVIKDFLKDFRGTDRRFQIKGEKNRVTIVDDYAHHPTEIRSTLEGAKKFYKGKKLIAIFEPHQYSRTKMLLGEFGASFGNADLVIVLDIYAARDSEQDIKSVSAQDLVNEIKKNEKEALHISGYDNVVKYLRENVKENSVVMTIGAGNVYKVGEEFLK